MTSTFFFFFFFSFEIPVPPPRARTMSCALKPTPRVTRSSGSAFANGGASLVAPMRALSVASTAGRRPMTVEGEFFFFSSQRERSNPFSFLEAA